MSPSTRLYPLAFFTDREHRNLSCAFAAGVPFTVSVISIPQRLQSVNSFNPFEAGLRLLPFAVAIPVGSMAQSIAAKKGTPPVALLLAGGLLQVAGTAAQAALPREVRPEMYVEQMITGFGIGVNLGTLVLWTPFVVSAPDTGECVPKFPRASIPAIASSACMLYKLMTEQ